MKITAWKVPKYGKYGPEKTPYLETFHAVDIKCRKWIYTKNKKIDSFRISL